MTRTLSALAAVTILAGGMAGAAAQQYAPAQQYSPAQIAEMQRHAAEMQRLAVAEQYAAARPAVYGGGYGGGYAGPAYDGAAYQGAVAGGQVCNDPNCPVHHPRPANVCNDPNCPNCHPQGLHHGGLGLHGLGHHGLGGGHPVGPGLATAQPFAGDAGPPTGQVTYPYYTTRGPRDFFDANPPSIGPGYAR